MSLELPAKTSGSAPLRRLWWLHPGWLFSFVIGTTIVAAVLQSEESYARYGADKFVDMKYLLFAAIAIAVFALGVRVASATCGIPKPTSPEADRAIRFWFWLTFALAIFGYAVWAGVGIKNGVSLDMLGGLVTDTDTYGAEETVRKELFPTIPGVTTCCQFGVATVLLGLWLYIHGDRRVVWPMVLITLLAMSRTVLWRERTAVLAMGVPAFAIWFRAYVLNRPITPLARRLLRLAPVLGIVGMLVFFGGFEYFRSWRIYKQEFSSYTEFTLWRVGGYFTTAHNNGAMAWETQSPLPLPFWTLRPFWEFPGVEESRISYLELTGLDPAVAHEDMLKRYGTVEFNNEGGLFSPLIDYGVFGYTVFWFVCGIISGAAYRGFLAGTFGGVMLYSIIFLAILNTPLILFICFPAALPPIATLLVVTWLVRRGSGAKGARAPGAVPMGA